MPDFVVKAQWSDGFVGFDDAHPQPDDWVIWWRGVGSDGRGPVNIFNDTASLYPGDPGTTGQLEAYCVLELYGGFIADGPEINW